MNKFFFMLSHDLARKNAQGAIARAPDGWIMTLSEPNRTLDQNAAQWPILTEIASQKQWQVNGQPEWLTPDEFKDVLTAAFRKEEPRLAAGLDGGVVMLGQRTSQFGKKEFSQWLEFLHYVAARFEVKLKQ